MYISIVGTPSLETAALIPRTLTFPYLLKRVFRSVALVVEARPLTHRFLPPLAAALPAGASYNTDRQRDAGELRPNNKEGVSKAL